MGNSFSRKRKDDNKKEYRLPTTGYRVYESGYNDEGSVWFRRHRAESRYRERRHEYIEKETVINGDDISSYGDSVLMYCSGITFPSNRHLIKDVDHTYQELVFPPPPIPPRINLQRSKLLSHQSDSEEETDNYDIPESPKMESLYALSEEDSDPPYEQRLTKHKSTFLTKLTVPHVLPHLHSVLDDAELATIYNTGTRKSYSRATEVLLQKLKASNSPAKWEVFMKALKASGHTGLAQLMENDSAKIEDDDGYAMVREFKPQLRELITPHELLPHLVARNVMTPEDADQIKRKEMDKGERAAADLLLDRIHRKHPNWFKEFLYACENIKHDDLLQLLHSAENRSSSSALSQEKTQVVSTKFSSVIDKEGENRSSLRALSQEKTQVVSSKFSSVTDKGGEAHTEESAHSEEVKTRDARSSPENITTDDYEDYTEAPARREDFRKRDSRSSFPKMAVENNEAHTEESAHSEEVKTRDARSSPENITTDDNEYYTETPARREDFRDRDFRNSFPKMAVEDNEKNTEEHARSESVKTRDARRSPKYISQNNYEERVRKENKAVSAKLDASAKTKSTEKELIYWELQLLEAKQEEYKKDIALYNRLKKARQECERLCRLAAACKLEAEEDAFLERKKEVDDSRQWITKPCPPKTTKID